VTAERPATGPSGLERDRGEPEPPYPAAITTVASEHAATPWRSRTAAPNPTDESRNAREAGTLTYPRREQIGAGAVWGAILIRKGKGGKLFCLQVIDNAEIIDTVHHRAAPVIPASSRLRSPLAL